MESEESESEESSREESDEEPNLKQIFLSINPDKVKNLLNFLNLLLDDNSRKETFEDVQFTITNPWILIDQKSIQIIYYKNTFNTVIKDIITFISRRYNNLKFGIMTTVDNY